MIAAIRLVMLIDLGLNVAKAIHPIRAVELPLGGSELAQIGILTAGAFIVVELVDALQIGSTYLQKLLHRSK